VTCHQTAGKAFIHLCEIMAQLRSRQGCPWDALQTPASLKPYIIEEAYELIDAIDSGDVSAIREELGDLLLQVVFQAQIHAEEEIFDISDVVKVISEKLVRRHPHVFAEQEVRAAEWHKLEWDRIKATEKSAVSPQAGSLSGLPRHLPALQKCQKIYRRLSRYDQQDKLTGHLDKHCSGSGNEPGRTTPKRQILTSLLQTVLLAEQNGIDAEGLLREFNASLSGDEVSQG
jgi:nucleoside triphosphate diphosphatase